jgi:hypothetical protein
MTSASRLDSSCTTIIGAWEASADGREWEWEHDFDTTYTETG